MSKKKQELTPWFRRKTKPVRKGVYSVQGTSFGNEEVYSHWDGRHWNGAWWTVDGAHHNRNFFSFEKHEGACGPRLEWRGLAKKP